MVDQDVYSDNVAAYAAKHGYRRLILLNNEAAGIHPTLIDDYHRSSKLSGISIELHDGMSCPRNLLSRRSGFPSINSKDTLALRLKKFGTATDQIISNKDTCLRALRLFQSQHKDDRFLVPPTIDSRQPKALPDNGNAPNLVYKLPDIDAGSGVFFLRAKSVSDARAIVEREVRKPKLTDPSNYLLRRFSHGVGEYQPFIRSHLTSDRRLFKIRTNALIAPAGGAFLSAGRIIGASVIPDDVPYGLIEQSRAFLVNAAFGGSEVPILPSEEQPAIQATLGVTNALRWVLNRGFDCGDAVSR
jgi:hypothetical protein